MWTGVEYQVVVCMIEEAFTIIKAIRDRYDGYKICPWSEKCTLSNLDRVIVNKHFIHCNINE